ncbi:unnamed protein product [Peniophora sp. CBMAI 1063]|nr:unnamed protein product [Peniophora sp. CBMAI 1063]
MSKRRALELEDEKKPLSPWIPVTLLAVTSVALAVPLLYLRRQRAAALAKDASAAVSAASTAPPRRLGRGIPAAQAALEQSAALAARPASNAPPPRRRVTALSGSIAATPAPSDAPAPSLAAAPAASSSTLPQDDGFNVHLYGIKAFGGATAIVLLAAASGVWGVKAYMGVEDPQDFAKRMRVVLADKLPALAARINRTLDATPLTAPFALPISLPAPKAEDLANDAPPPVTDDEARSWRWADAKKRLADAYEEGGASQWFEVALREMEMEAGQIRQRDSAQEHPRTQT